MRLHSRRCLALLRQNSTVLGALVVSVLWIGVYVTFRQAYVADYREQVKTSVNLGLLLEETTLRTIGEIDKSLFYLRRLIEARLGTIDYHLLISRQDILSEMIVQAAIIDAGGMMRATSASKGPAKPIDLSDREHYRYHVGRDTDELFISKPLIGRASGKWSVQLTRKFRNKEGEFSGVVVASLDPAHLTDFFTTVDLGPRGSISLIGLDGVVRASGGIPDVGLLKLGESIAGSNVFQRMLQGDAGTFSYKAASGDSRVISYRRIRGQPLIVANSFSEPDVYWQAYQTLSAHSTVAAILSVFIFGACMRSAKDQLRIGVMQSRARRSRQRALRTAERLRLTLENITQGIMLVRRDLTIPVINRRTIELLELPSDWQHHPPRFDALIEHLEAQGEFEAEPAPDGTRPPEQWLHDEAIGGQSTYERRRPNGTVLEVRTTVLPGGGFVRTLTDITHRRKAQAEVDRLAREDVVTGLANRREFHEVLERRVNGEPFVLLYLDLDRFKIVNDTLGHPVGDALLQAVAARIRSSIRIEDVAARLGGDEFAVLIDCDGTQETGRAVAERLVKSLSQPYEVDGHQILAGASIGIAIGPRDGSSADVLLKASDLALYAAKAAGRGTYRFFEPTMDEEIRLKRKLEMDLRRALENNEFELHYQPFFDIATKTLLGFEALIRWRHRERGLVSPADFIPIAEETGLMAPIGAWAIGQACHDALSWPEETRVAVNVSSMQFKTGDLSRDVHAALARSGLPAGRLELEITESTLMEQGDATVRVLLGLRALGVSISMDDFGTGYSSLSYLRRFPLNKIKIDRSFVMDLGSSPKVEVIIRSIIDIARTMDMTTTAEGIETPDQLDRLAALGCDVGQGYYFSKPRPVAELQDLIEEACGRAKAKAA
ncbi:MAG: EAL domain-containing protein [Hyphomicrobiaceae bacterium]|nr:EAL domain-containing protein [Hyphomicrobiaceae bacterium]